MSIKGYYVRYSASNNNCRHGNILANITRFKIYEHLKVNIWWRTGNVFNVLI